MSAFLSRTRRLLEDRAFILSAALSTGATVLFILMAVYLLSRDKINITKIAEVSVDSQDSQEHGKKTSVISGLYKLVNVDSSNPRTEAEILTFKSRIWSGYLATLEAFCLMSTNDQKVGVWVGGQFNEVDTVANVIVRTSDKIIAGVIKFSPKTCEIAKKLTGDGIVKYKNIIDSEQIYIVSDRPFEKMESIPVYLSIDKIYK